MNDEAARQGRPASNVTNRARSVAGVAAGVADPGNVDLSRAAFFCLCAHLRHGRIYFDGHGMAA